jgi:hypothetical protein
MVEIAPHIEAWREGLQPQLTDACLRALEKALMEDDKQFCQAYTTIPSVSIDGYRDQHTPSGADLCAFALWKGERLPTVGAVASRYEECLQMSAAKGYNAEVWQNWIDAAGRHEMVQTMLSEVQIELERRSGCWQEAV